jgi:Uma2 family endonuclease
VPTATDDPKTPREPVPYGRVTPQAYLVRERAAEYRSEYFDGDVVAMAGASPTHGRIVSNLATLLGSHLAGGPCEHFIADLRVQLAEANSYVYPDLVVVCGPAVFDASDNLENPALIIEVLSPSTERKDRGEKFAAYRARETLREYVLVAQDRPRVEVYRPAVEKSWPRVLMVEGLDAEVTLESIGCAIPMVEIYRRVFPALVSKDVSG